MDDRKRAEALARRLIGSPPSLADVEMTLIAFAEVRDEETERCAAAIRAAGASAGPAEGGGCDCDPNAPGMPPPPQGAPTASAHEVESDPSLTPEQVQRQSDDDAAAILAEQMSEPCRVAPAAAPEPLREALVRLLRTQTVSFSDEQAVAIDHACDDVLHERIAPEGPEGPTIAGVHALRAALREVARLTGVGPPSPPGRVRPAGATWYDLLVRVNAIASRALPATPSAQPPLAEPSPPTPQASETPAEGEVLARIAQWTHEHGDALKPRGADTYGEGMRDAKAQVATLLARRPHGR